MFVAFLIVGKSGVNKRTQMYNEMVQLAGRDDCKEVPVNKERLQVLIDAAVDVGANQQRDTIYKALFLAKSTDSTDVDLMIAEVATKQMMSSDIREVLIRDVLRKRKNPVVVPVLMAYCRSTNDSRAAINSIQACRFMATDNDLPKFLDIVIYNNNANIRKVAEETASEILKKSVNRESLGATIGLSLIHI